MFIAEENNSNELVNFIKSNQDKIMAVAFIGRGLSKIIDGNNKIICNLTSGATNPDEIKKLIKLQGVEIRNCSNLHSKVYFSERKLIVGSSNISTNGMALENDCAGWIEASIISTDSNTLASAQQWIMRLWNASEEITPELLNVAEKRFKAQRSNRSFKNYDLSDLKDRDIYCTLYKDNELSEEASDHADDILGNNWEKEGYAVYESWDDLPNGLLLDYFLCDNTVKYEGKHNFDGYTSKVKQTDIQIAKKNLDKGYKTKEISKIIMNNLKELWPNHKTEDATVIYINKIIECVRRV